MAKTGESAINVGMPNMVKKSPDFRTVYTNICRGASSAWDIRMTFGQMMDVDGKPPGEIYVEDLVGIIMSPEEAKAVSQILIKTIEQYEAVYGEIKDLTPVLDKLMAAKAQSSN